MNAGILTITIFLPGVAALCLATLARFLAPGAVKLLGLAVSVLAFLVSLSLATGFVPGDGFQFVDEAAWIPALGVSYKVGLDGVSLLMVLLTTLLTPLALLTAWGGRTKDVKGLTILLLALETAMLGVFASLDLFLFYVFWEASLIPMFFIVGIWGGGRRVYASLKFFLFTFGGSALMLAGLVVLAVLHWRATGTLTFDYATLAGAQLPLDAQRWLFWAFFLAFAVKIPMFPLHTWLPDAHVEAPTAGSVILAGVLLKMGGYGLIRFLPGLFPLAMLESGFLVALLGVAGIIYGAVMVMNQRDLKRLVAYSSVSHMGYVVAGAATLTAAGLSGAVLQMVSHGLATGALFAAVGILYERTHTREISAYGGLARVMPNFAWAFLLAVLASLGLPGTSGFVGEFAVLLGLWKFRPELAVFAVSGVILSAVYMLTMYRAVMHGPVARGMEALAPLSAREAVVLAVLGAGILAIGVWPAPWLDLIRPDIRGIIGGIAWGGAG